MIRDTLRRGVKVLCHQISLRGRRELAKCFVTFFVKELMDFGIFAIKTALKYRFLKNSNVTLHMGGGGLRVNVS